VPRFSHESYYRVFTVFPVAAVLHACQMNNTQGSTSAHRRPIGFVALLAALALTFSGLTAALAVAAPAQTKRSDKQVATALVNKMWTLAQNNDEAGLQAFINKAFQAQDADQPRWNKKQFIDVLVNGEELSSYTLSGLRATRSGNTIVVTYTAAASQVVDGKQLSGDPKPRMTAFIQSPKTKRYTVISHSSFNVASNS
jgi:hypothetical protein